MVGCACLKERRKNFEAFHAICFAVENVNMFMFYLFFSDTVAHSSSPLWHRNRGTVMGVAGGRGHHRATLFFSSEPHSVWTETSE